ncbi:unnamed protein product [Prorocentrum cordatum]|uniref:Secreted protein n=1 Tax=Prorocentrum cordatum TaxID=2364126 RepID=A0ABN9T3X8_9DINO|nr:unnamed protein product [Polarella glacialis]
MARKRFLASCVFFPTCCRQALTSASNPSWVGFCLKLKSGKGGTPGSSESAIFCLSFPSSLWGSSSETPSLDSQARLRNFMASAARQSQASSFRFSCTCRS